MCSLMLGGDVVLHVPLSDVWCNNAGLAWLSLHSMLMSKQPCLVAHPAGLMTQASGMYGTYLDSCHLIHVSVSDAQATSAAFNGESYDHPAQLLALLDSAVGLPELDRPNCISGIRPLLEGLLHPEENKRMTADQMRMQVWLQTAPQQALPKSPIRW